ncbi:MAG: glycoside hydrolase family 5 protein [Bacilli bacterium]
MKKIYQILIILLLLFSISSCSNKEQINNNNNNKETYQTQSNNKEENSNNSINNSTTSNPKNNFVSYNGNLKVKGTSIVNQYDEEIQLKGISSHGLQWYGDYINENNIKILRDEWNSNVFRIAMYTAENGYIQNKNIRETLIEKIDLLISMDMYVIIDWHILSDGNPLTYVRESKEFFDFISKKYADVPNVIYEICNEPNGADWNNHIKPYADQVIPVIRKNSQKSIIIVGTNTWCQDILEPINNRINDENVMYAVHFYAGTHTNWLRDRVSQALNSGLPIFVSEWGTSKADGNGGVFTDEAQKWIDFMKENNISWCNWSLSDKNETSALLKPGAGVNGINLLSESGEFVKKAILK